MGKSRDAFRTISEVAEWLNIQTHVLRFWESKFSQVKPVKRAGGRRYYRPHDMLLLGGIKKLLHDDGLTIKGAQKLLREQGVKHVSGLSQPIDTDNDDTTEHVQTPAPVEIKEIIADQAPDAPVSAPIVDTPDTPVVPGPPDQDAPAEVTATSEGPAADDPTIKPTSTAADAADVAPVPSHTAPPATDDLFAAKTSDEDVPAPVAEADGSAPAIQPEAPTGTDPVVSDTSDVTSQDPAQDSAADTSAQTKTTEQQATEPEAEPQDDAASLLSQQEHQTPSETDISDAAGENLDDFLAALCRATHIAPNRQKEGAELVAQFEAFRARAVQSEPA